MIRLPLALPVLVALTLLSALLAGRPGEPAAATSHIISEVYIPNAAFPLALDFAPDGRLFYTEHCTGNVRIVTAQGQLLATEFAHVDSPACGDWGLTGMAIDPDFENTHYVFVHYMELVTANPLIARPVVKRFTEVNNIGTNPTVILSGPPTLAYNLPYHAADEIHFGPDGYLYVSLGDQHEEEQSVSQDLSVLEGKILRLNKEDGSAPPDNPFVGTQGADARIFAYGLRNAFGFTFDDQTGTIFLTENGPERCDELNIVQAGANYGWPLPYESVSTCAVATGEQPIYWYTLAIGDDPWMPGRTGAPVGIDYVEGDVYPSLGDSILTCLWRTGEMRHMQLSPAHDQVTSEDTIASGCYLDVEVGPDGAIYYTDSGNIRRLWVDSDGDGVKDGTDNCPALAGADQTNTDADLAAAGAYLLDGPLPADSQGDICDDDDDNDRFDDDVEQAIGTNPLDNCPGAPGTGGDSWPLDNTGNGIANVTDVYAYKGLIPNVVDDAHPKRLDLTNNDILNVTDVYEYKGNIPKVCG